MKPLFWVGRYVSIRIKFKWQDVWVGAYIEGRGIYICIIPMIPIHITWFTSGKLKQGKEVKE